MLKFFIKIALPLVILVFFTNQVSAVNQIKGKLLNNTAFTKIELVDMIANKVIGTSELNKKNEFNIKANVLESDFYKLQLDESNYLILILDPNQNITIEINIDKFFEPKITGSEQTELFYASLRTLNFYESKQDSLDAVYSESYYSEDEATTQKLLEEYTSLEEKKIDFLKNLIQNNAGKLTVMFFVDKLDMDENYTLFKKVSEDLRKNYPTNQYVTEFANQVSLAGKLAVGAVAPEIAFPDTSGNILLLSSTRGKYVLIDFWAAWCRPCRMESPNMVRMYNTYKDKGFTLFSVSLDKEKEDWLQAIQADQLGAWPHVSDLKYWESDAVALYGIQGIPFTVLIDPNGVIIAKNLRGEKLEAKLAEIFAK